MMPSTARASSTRWWHGPLRARDRFLFCRRTGPVSEPIATGVPAPFCPLIYGRTRACGRRYSPALTGRADTDTGYDQRWRERPRQGTLGSDAGHGSGVVHAIVGAVTSTSTLLDEAADSAASWSPARQRTSLQAFACGSCSCATRGERGSAERRRNWGANLTRFSLGPPLSPDVTVHRSGELKVLAVQQLHFDRRTTACAVVRQR